MSDKNEDENPLLPIGDNEASELDENNESSGGSYFSKRHLTKE